MRLEVNLTTINILEAIHDAMYGEGQRCKEIPNAIGNHTVESVQTEVELMEPRMLRKNTDSLEGLVLNQQWDPDGERKGHTSERFCIHQRGFSRPPVTPLMARP